MGWLKNDQILSIFIIITPIKVPMLQEIDKLVIWNWILTLMNTITIGVGHRIWRQVVLDSYLVHYGNPWMHLRSTCNMSNHITFSMHVKDIYDEGVNVVNATWDQWAHNHDISNLFSWTWILKACSSNENSIIKQSLGNTTMKCIW